MSGDGGRMDSGVAFGRARGGPGRTALASRLRIARLLDARLPSSPASRRGWAAAAALGVVATIAAAPRVSQGVAAVTTSGTTATPTQRAAEPVVVRQPAARGSSQDTTVVLALIARLKDENAGVRGAAARSLGHLGDPRAV